MSDHWPRHVHVTVNVAEDLEIMGNVRLEVMRQLDEQIASLFRKDIQPTGIMAMLNPKPVTREDLAAMVKAMDPDYDIDGPLRRLDMALEQQRHMIGQRRAAAQTTKWLSEVRRPEPERADPTSILDEEDPWA